MQYSGEGVWHRSGVRTTICVTPTIRGVDRFVGLQCYLRGRAGKGLNSQWQGTKHDEGTADHGVGLEVELAEIDANTAYVIIPLL